MKPKLYLETTIPSYLTAWTSGDIVRAAHQHTTRRWWELRRSGFGLYVSQLVIEEVSAGDPTAATDRLAILQDITVLEVDPDAADLAAALIREVRLPAKASSDAIHIAVAAVNGLDYLLTWNCTHIANAAFQKGIRSVCQDRGYEPPFICTPLELLEV